jgi:glyoxylase-like metal-dependent hydrolase (beta-lactamase superfamily II)
MKGDEERDTLEIRDAGPGLWISRMEHPKWKPGEDWEPVVTSTVVESEGECMVIDGLAPPPTCEGFWERLDECRPTLAVVLSPDHVRDVDVFIRRYGARGFGPGLFDRDNIPESNLTPIRQDSCLPGGFVALYAGHSAETPLWLPEQKTIVFADSLTERGGELRVWTSPWHDERVLPALRALLELPFESVIISHGEPVHSRAAFERALEVPPWPCAPLHKAAWFGSLGLVRRLVEAGADPGALDEINQRTPLEWARAARQEAVVAYLESVASGRA